MSGAPPTAPPLAGGDGGVPRTPAPPAAAAEGLCSASRWSALTPRRRLDALLHRTGATKAAARIQGLWCGYRVRQRVLVGGKPCCCGFIADGLVRKLQRHQLLGVRWLYAAATRGGGILADDPGLGKTLQAIATVEALISSGWARRVLVVAPANLLANWQMEFRRWLGRSPLNIVVAGAGEAGLRDELKFSQLASPMDDAGQRGHLVLASRGGGGLTIRRPGAVGSARRQQLNGRVTGAAGAGGLAPRM